MNKQLLEKLGIDIPVQEITSYKTSQGALYENKELAEKAEMMIQLDKLIFSFLDTREKIYCHDCDSSVDIRYELSAFAKFLINKLGE